jgi:two-component system chemotaxis response regulator CheB
MDKIKVLIVDDSLFIRQMFSKIISDQDDMVVISTAEDANEAREKIKLYNPDVITLDIEMPGMNGLEFLEKIMALRPTPVIMASSLTQNGADATIKALELGAIDYVPKSSSQDFDIDNMKDELVSKIRVAAKNKSTVLRASSSLKSSPKENHENKNYSFKQDILFAIGASTGGVESIKEVITELPKNFPPIVITQHMPESFTKSFANRLNTQSAMFVKEAENGEVIEKGKVYIAKGGVHLEVIKRGAQMICVLSDGEKVSGHIPSVDVLFSSVAKNIGSKAYGVILTGMGKDGAVGMLEMKNEGCYNIGQDEQSSVVYGMPKAAFQAGAVHQQFPLSRISAELIRLASN